MENGIKKRIGLFGGSFNPPHMGHVLVVGWALATGRVDAVWVIPTGGHPFGKPLASFEDRFAMCRMAFACYGDRVRVLEIEKSPGVHYSVDTVERLARENPDVAWRWIIGADAMAQSAEWKNFERLSELAPPLVVGRQGHGAGDAGFELPAISSTLLRRRLAADRSDPQLVSLVPDAVLRHVRAHNLYTDP